MLPTLLDEIRQFVRLQTQLARAFQELDARDEDSRAEVESVQLYGHEWRFTIHGDGVRFRRENGVTVDIHTDLDRPELFDAWRLATYFRSLRQGGVKLLTRVCADQSGGWDAVLDGLLADLVETGSIEAVDNLLRVRE